MSAMYSETVLKQMKGQAVKDVWHAMIGKPAGIKNTTGLKNSDEIIQAILEAQQHPEFLQSYKVKDSKQIVPREPVEMPPKSGEKKKPGPKPKPNPMTVSAPLEKRPTVLQAYESTEAPIRPSEIVRISVKKLHIGDTLYFLDSKTNKVYKEIDGKPGPLCGVWNVETRSILTLNLEA
jgi:hypothetical protein